MKIRVKLIDETLGNPLPSYATVNSSGMDIASASPETIIIPPGESYLIPTNLIFEIPPGFEGQVRPRSGLAINYNIGIINSPGTIDADYRGELKIILTNFSKVPFEVKFGDRIAQLVIARVERAEIVKSNDLSTTGRNDGGFGHTGI
jgi:dUTP pyrophosphatase